MSGVGCQKEGKSSYSSACHLPPDTSRRYARHLVLAEIGEAGQRKLLESSVLVIGAGGLGTASLGYLAAMGVGRLGIVEPDYVELSNLQRQLLYEQADIGRTKADAARDRLEEINPECQVVLHKERLDAGNALALIQPYDLVLDGSDNFATRFAVHEACYAEKKTLVSAAISGFAMQVSTFKAHLGAPHPCYRCFVPEAPPREVNCAQEGILGALGGVAGSLQAAEAVKELLGIGESLSGKILAYDALAAEFRKMLLHRDPQCRLCSKN